MACKFRSRHIWIHKCVGRFLHVLRRMSFALLLFLGCNEPTPNAYEPSWWSQDYRFKQIRYVERRSFCLVCYLSWVDEWRQYHSVECILAFPCNFFLLSCLQSELTCMGICECVLRYQVWLCIVSSNRICIPREWVRKQLRWHFIWYARGGRRFGMHASCQFICAQFVCGKMDG